jgi:hypothetical protein
MIINRGEGALTERINHLKSEIKRVNGELTRLSGFTLSSDIAVQSLRKYKKDLYNKIELLVKKLIKINHL